jgi:hypothetical protein
MIQEPNENYGMEDRNYQLASEGINSETMENQDPAFNQRVKDDSDSVLESQDSDLDNYARNDYDPYQDELDDEDMDTTIDQDLDDDDDLDDVDDLDDEPLGDIDSNDDFDEKDRSDY